MIQPPQTFFFFFFFFYTFCFNWGFDFLFFNLGYEELTAGPAGVDYSKGYNSSSQTQAKSAASGPGKGRNQPSIPP